MFRENRNMLTCWHWDGILTLIGLLKVLVVGDREGNWESHLQVIEKLLSIFLISVSINYLRYWSWYLEEMRKLPHEHPEVYKYFQEEKFVVKTNAGYVTLKQWQLTWKLNRVFSAQKKGPGGIIGQTKHETYVTEWELAYHEVWLWAKAMAKSWNQFWQIQMQILCTNNWVTIICSIMKQ